MTPPPPFDGLAKAKKGQNPLKDIRILAFSVVQPQPVKINFALI